MRIVTTVSVSLAVLCAAGQTVGAAPELVYGQRPGQKESGKDCSIYARVADDFVLGADTQVVSASFWGYLGRSRDGDGWPGEFEVGFWAAGDYALPDVLLFAQTFSYSDLSKTTVFGDVTQFTADFGAPVQLSGSTNYWFSIGFPSGGGAFTWMFQGTGGPDSSVPGDYVTQDRIDNPWKVFPAREQELGLAFSLNGEPEMSVIPLPSASALAGLGLAGLAGRRRRVRC